MGKKGKDREKQRIQTACFGGLPPSSPKIENGPSQQPAGADLKQKVVPLRNRRPLKKSGFAFSSGAPPPAKRHVRQHMHPIRPQIKKLRLSEGDIEA